MIVALEGIIEGLGQDSAIIRVGPISLKIFTPASTLNQLKSVGRKIRLNTHLHIREDNISIYGFFSVEELNLFQNLISVSGIGPKAALSLLSAFATEQLASAIASGDTDLLSQVSGIGKKTAGRIVLELKGRLEKEWGKFVVPALSKGDADVIAALTSLGYSVKEATQAIAVLPDSGELNLEEKVRLALQQLAKL